MLTQLPATGVLAPLTLTANSAPKYRPQTVTGQTPQIESAEDWSLISADPRANMMDTLVPDNSLRGDSNE